MNPSGQTGGLGTGNQSTATPAQVTIGGQTATVVYSGAAPQSVLGLYQVNVVVPASAPSGSVALSVAFNGTTAQSGVTLYVQ